jgi:hypothetical protein
MGTLQIPGIDGTFEVDDSFGSLSPEEQQRAVGDMSRAARVEQMKLSNPNRGNFFDRFVGQGLLMSFGDEVKAGVRGGAEYLFNNPDNTPFRDIYDRNVAGERADAEAFAERNPKTAMAADIGGGVAGALIPGLGGAGLVARGATGGARLGRAALAGGASSAAVEMGQETGSLADRFSAETLGAGALGASTAGLTQGLLNGLAARRTAANMPTRDDFAQLARRHYRAADQSGAMLSDKWWNRTIGHISRRAQREGLHPRLTPKASSAIRHLQSLSNRPMRIGELDQARKVLRTVADDVLPNGRMSADGRLGVAMINDLDQAMMGARPRDALGGISPEEGFRQLDRARNAWHRGSKLDIIEWALHKADASTGNFSQGGMDNALKTAFKAITTNRRLFNRFNAEERRALMKIAKGGGLTERFFRLFGKLNPRGVVSALGGGIMGHSVGGMPGVAGMYAGGAASAGIATAMRKGNVRQAQAATAGIPYTLDPMRGAERGLQAAAQGTMAQHPEVVPQAAMAGAREGLENVVAPGLEFLLNR